MEEGYHAVNLNMSDEPSGIYFYTLASGNFRDTKKLIFKGTIYKVVHIKNSL